VIEAVRHAVRQDLAERWDGIGVRLDASVAVVTATSHGTSATVGVGVAPA
jgi:hypothetical protein